LAEWLGFPDLKKEDIAADYLREKFLGEDLVRTKKGRIVVIMEQDVYQEFLAAVKKRFGDISHHHVNGAALQALKEWAAKNR